MRVEAIGTAGVRICFRANFDVENETLVQTKCDEVAKVLGRPVEATEAWADQSKLWVHVTYSDVKAVGTAIPSQTYSCGFNVLLISTNSFKVRVEGLGVEEGDVVAGMEVEEVTVEAFD